MNEADGKKLLSFVRTCVLKELKNEKIEIPSDIKKFNQKQGLFVTIHSGGQLRGCIGFIIGHYPLYEGLKHAAHSAAFEDPRFNPINIDEWDTLDFEISILSIPQEIKVKPPDLPSNVKVGVDGLICEAGPYTGLLLPQVATEWKWDASEFLSHTCEKAGLPNDTWKSGKCKFKKFQAQIFKEN